MLKQILANQITIMTVLKETIRIGPDADDYEREFEFAIRESYRVLELQTKDEIGIIATKVDIGKWVLYHDHGMTELGRIKSITPSYFVIVVFKCDNNWNDFQNYTGARCQPKQLTFTEKRPDGYDEPN